MDNNKFDEKNILGVYVPTLTSLLVDNIQSGFMGDLNLVGMAVGNGELSSIQQLNSAIHMGYFHGLYDKKEFDSLQQCCDSSAGGTWCVRFMLWKV